MSLNESEFGLDALWITSLGVISTGIDLDLGNSAFSLFVESLRDPRVGEFLALPRTVEASTAISVSSSKIMQQIDCSDRSIKQERTFVFC